MHTKRSFAVVTDSTADIPPALVAGQGISVVPLMVSFGDETFADGVLSQPEFFARMAKSPALPTTSTPSVGAFADAFTLALESAPEVISLHISSGLSGTVEAARQAAADFEGRVHVFDSLNLSGGLMLQVFEAVRAADKGLSVTDTLELLIAARKRAKMIVGVDSLDNLARGGRIGKVSALLGAMLDLKITLTVDEEGKFTPLARKRGEKAAIAYTLDWVEEQLNGAPSAYFAVGHAMTAERAGRLRDAIAARFNATEIIMYEAGSVVATHTGTVWGVALLPVG